jgi:hypothetical protein
MRYGNTLSSWSEKQNAKIPAGAWPMHPGFAARREREDALG